MNKIFNLIDEIPHKTESGEEFLLRVKKWRLTAAHNYWLYFIEAEHASWGKQTFTACVTKQAYPQEQLADRLAQTVAVDEAKGRLEQTTAEGRPLLIPFLTEGWCML